MSVEVPKRQPPARVRNRRRVMRAAHALVTKDGLEALTMRRLAVEADVSVATLYNLIGGRDDVVRALGLYFLEELQEAFFQVEASDPLKRARGLLTVVIEAVVKELPPALLLKLLSDAQLHTDLRPSWEPNTALADALQAMVAAGMLSRELSVSLISKQVWWAQVAHLQLWAAGILDERELHAAVLHDLDLCLLAIATPAAREHLLDHARSLERKLRHV